MKKLTVYATMALLFSISLQAQTAPGNSGARPAPHKEKVELPAGVSQSWWARVQKQIRADEYNLDRVASDPNAWRAFNRAQGFETTFTRTGIKVMPKRKNAPSWAWGLTFTGIGREHPAPSPLVSREAAKNRISFYREEVEEWFLNSEDGLEQGFTIPVPPGGSLSSVPLRIDLRLTGTLHPTFSEDGRAVDFYAGGNVSVLRYGALKATDATGRELPARFESIPGGIRIAVDDSKAVYPVTVDPMVTTPAWSVAGEADYDNLGYSVATAGDVNGDGFSDVLVGARYNDTGGNNAGKAYLYTGSASGLFTAPAWSVTGETDGDNFGWSVATAGDVNGDGYSDILVGAIGSGSSAGKVYLYTGSTSGLSTTPDWSAVGEAADNYFGWSVATAGDVNGDGYSDILVGAYGNGSSAGKVYLYTGSASGLSTTPTWNAVGEVAGDDFGYCVATAGDVNGDGYSDILVGAIGNNSSAGKAYLYTGNASGLSSTFAWSAVGEVAGDELGRSVATAGDVDGDGFSDVLVGARYNDNGGTDAGKAYLYTGSASGLSSTPDWSAVGEAADDRFGFSVATAGDVNGDGFADILVGAVGYSGGTNAGKAYLYMGSGSGLATTPAWSAVGEADGDQFGVSVATAGDVNGDGFSDILVGARYNDDGGTNAGKAYLYTGSASGLTTTSAWSAVGEHSNDMFGNSVATAGDVNGDGFSDILVGARYNDDGGTNAGKVYLYTGSASGLSTTPAWSIAGEAANDYFGASVATAGDVNGDGFSDILVGATGYPGGSGVGKAYLYAGSTSGLSSTPAWSAVGEHSDDYFGHSVATAGDVNGDGYSDVLVGADGNDDNGDAAGKAYLYTGSASGLSTTFVWSAVGESAVDNFGHSVATAGDVNGDGYSDVLVGASGNGSGPGKAYCYLGSAAGLSATFSWSAVGEHSGDYFGWSVATAGDVNGDGYSDILVGTPYNAAGGSNAGKAYLYTGSSSGLSSTPAWSAVGEADYDYLGRSVATAGDVNGDGFSDILVGANQADGTISGAGKAHLYTGSVSGLSTTPAWSAAGETSYDNFGYSVATAGDVNGDGFSDILVGAFYNDDGGTNAGKAYLYLGNGGLGIPVLPRQLRSDLSAPIAPLGRSEDGLFKLALKGRTPFGRGEVKLEWQVGTLGHLTLNPPATAFAWQESGTSGVDLTRTLVLDDGDGPYLWRMRTRFNPVTTPFQPHGPWLTIAANNVTETDLRRVPACVLPDEKCWIYEVDKSVPDNYPILNWEEWNQPNQYTGWNVRRSNDPALPKDEWPIVASNIVDGDEATPNNQWTDTSGDDPGPGGIWYYEVTSYNTNCPAEGPF